MWHRALIMALHCWPWGPALGSCPADGHTERRSKQGCGELHHLGAMQCLWEAMDHWMFLFSTCAPIEAIFLPSSFPRPLPPQSLPQQRRVSAGPKPGGCLH